MDTISGFLFDGDNYNGDDVVPSAGQTCELCGWVSAFIGMLAFGSFGVPVKSKMAKSLNIDPLVMQSYKTGMCFVTSWLFLLVRGEAVTFTPWGIVSGLFWVPGGVATIYAIKTAGLAVGIGVGSSFIVLVSFTWGIFFFDEHVHSRYQACSAVACMLCGLAGMAYYSAPTVAHAEHNSRQQQQRGTDDVYYQPVRPEDLDFLPPTEAFESSADYTSMDVEQADQADNDDIDNPTNTSNEEEAIVEIIEEDADDFGNETHAPTVTLFGCLKIQERILGILAALFITGIWGGSVMVPMQFSPSDCNGLPYLTSFSIGASLVTLLLWLIRYLYLWHKHEYCASTAYNALPSFHFRKMWPYGCTCGLLWSIGNFFSILAVENLGEGVGYSTTQASMLVSGVWGIFYFREIEGTGAILKWNAAASVTVLGILLLSYEHHEA